MILFQYVRHDRTPCPWICIPSFFLTNLALEQVALLLLTSIQFNSIFSQHELHIYDKQKNYIPLHSNIKIKINNTEQGTTQSLPGGELTNRQTLSHWFILLKPLIKLLNKRNLAVVLLLT